MFDDITRELFLELSENIRNFSEDLKKGNFTNIIRESDKIIQKYLNKSAFIKRIIFSDPNFGLNLQIRSFTGVLLFPSMLYQNAFRLEITKRLIPFLEKCNSFNELEFFLTKIWNSTVLVKKGGFNRSNLEVLRFFLTNFDNKVDIDIKNYLSLLRDYDYKFYKLTSSTLLKKFNLIMECSAYLLLPRFINFGINAVMFHHNELNDFSFSDLQSYPLGYVFDNTKKAKFSLFFTPYNRELKANVIENISFFENLDLFHEEKRLKKLINYSRDIFDVYYNFQEKNFQDTAISFKLEFFTKKNFVPQTEDLDLLIHLFNTRRLPIDHQIHPVSQYYFPYRNKIVNFYGSTNYFIYIFEPERRIITTNVDLITTLLKNTFANGYVIQSKSGFLISTFLFKKDFENIRSSFIEFFQLFKLEVVIYEDLNLIPFSFYQIPYSLYFDPENTSWQFPVYQEQPIPERMKYQLANFTAEQARLEDPLFASRVSNYLTNWTSEITSLRKS